jgi:hypothetical protein
MTVHRTGNRGAEDGAVLGNVPIYLGDPNVKSRHMPAAIEIRMPAGVQ